MLVERAELLIREGSEQAFAEMMAKEGLPLLRTQPGVLAVRAGPGVENPGKYMLLVDWESIEAHRGYQQGEDAARFRTLLMPYSIGGSMEHFELS